MNLINFLEVRHLRTLMALKETGSVVEAAERLHVTQSALSHQLKELETRIDRPLFIRKSKPLKFTEAGQLLLNLAHEVLPNLSKTEQQLMRLQSGEAGRLHIVIECHSCFDWLMPALNDYRQHHPDVEVDLSTGFNFSSLDALLRQDVDLVITSDPEPHNRIEYIPLFQYEARLVVANDHPLALKGDIQAEDLINEQLISYPVDKQKLDVFRLFLWPAKCNMERIRHSELTLMMIQLVASQRGIAVLPNWAVQEYEDKGLVTTRPLGEGIWSTLYLAVRKEQGELSYLTSFFGIAKDQCFANLAGIKHI